MNNPLSWVLPNPRCLTFSSKVAPLHWLLSALPGPCPEQPLLPNPFFQPFNPKLQVRQKFQPFFEVKFLTHLRKLSIFWYPIWIFWPTLVLPLLLFSAHEESPNGVSGSEVRVFVRKKRVKMAVETPEKEIKAEPQQQKVRIFTFIYCYYFCFIAEDPFFFLWFFIIMCFWGFLVPSLETEIGVRGTGVCFPCVAW